jgi:hypothetical protein
VHLDLVDGRDDVDLAEQALEVVLHEVRDADCARAAGGEHLFDRLVCADGAVELARDRVVQQEEIDVVDAEPPQAAVEADECLVAVVADPELGDHEDLAAVDLGAPDPLADLALVAIGGGRVDEGIAARDRSLDRVRRFLRRALEDAEPEGGHLDAVVQRQSRDGRGGQCVLLERDLELQDFALVHRAVALGDVLD